nr:hydroxyacid dehydrogenase [Actinomycetota bacterium]
MSGPRVALLPAGLPVLLEAVEAGGGTVADLGDADALVWTNPADPEGLRDALATASVRWVQLPFAGIESFVAAGVVDGSHTWTCTKGVYGHTTAEHALALMLAAARRIHVHAAAGRWEEVSNPFERPERTLRETTVLLVGTGGIGRALVGMVLP